MCFTIYSILYIVNVHVFLLTGTKLQPTSLASQFNFCYQFSSTYPDILEHVYKLLWNTHRGTEGSLELDFLIDNSMQATCMHENLQWKNHYRYTILSVYDWKIAHLHVHVAISSILKVAINGTTPLYIFNINILKHFKTWPLI